MKSKKTIFEYTNYREFLKDTYAESKARNPQFSFRVFSRMAGFKAGNILKLVMDGERNIAHDSIDKYCKALKLGREEAKFFRSLVMFNQAQTSEEKARFAHEIMRSEGYRKMHPLSEMQFRCLSKWYFLPVREMVRLPGFQEDPAWVAKQVQPHITAAEAKQALDELMAIGLLVRDANGKLQQANQAVTTPDEVTSSAAAQFHREMLKRASESIDRFSRENRELTALTFTISRKTAKQIKEKVREFRKDIIDVIMKDSEIPDSVYQLNAYLFPIVFEEEKKS